LQLTFQVRLQHNTFQEISLSLGCFESRPQQIDKFTFGMNARVQPVTSHHQFDRAVGWDKQRS
jgi:hypothetical protein